MIRNSSGLHVALAMWFAFLSTTALAQQENPGTASPQPPPLGLMNYDNTVAKNQAKNLDNALEALDNMNLIKEKIDFRPSIIYFQILCVSVVTIKFMRETEGENVLAVTQILNRRQPDEDTDNRFFPNKTKFRSDVVGPNVFHSCGEEMARLILIVYHESEHAKGALDNPSEMPASETAILLKELHLIKCLVDEKDETLKSFFETNTQKCNAKQLEAMRNVWKHRQAAIEQELGL